MKELAIKGAFWTGVETLGGQALSFITFFILARILAPEDFGVVNLAAVLIAIPQVLINQGFQEAIIQREVLDDDHISTALWSNLAISLIFFAATWASAGLIASLFGYPMLAPVLRFLAINFVFTALVSIPGALFRRNLNFFTFALRSIVGALLGGVIGIWMALAGYGIWALLGNILANGAASVVIIWLGNAWRPKFRFSMRAFHDLFGFTARTMAGNLISFAVVKCDTVLIGAFLDEKALGNYYLVKKLFETAEAVTVSPISAISMPVLSRLMKEPARFERGYSLMVWMTGFLWLPTVAGMGILAGILPVIFGPQWSGAVPIMQIMSILALTEPLMSHTNRALYSSGQPAIFVRLAIANAILMVMLIVPATHFGITGVAWALVLLSLVMMIISLWVLRRYVHLRIKHLLGRYAIIVAAGLIMVATVKVLSFYVPENLYGLATQIGVGAFVYLMILCIFANDEMATLANTARGYLPKRKTRPAEEIV